MTIQQVPDYDFPSVAELADSTAGWRLSPERCAVLVHDMQRYFVDFFFEGGSVRKTLIDNIGQLLHGARTRNIPVFYTAQPGSMTRRQRGLLHDIWGAGMTSHPRHREIWPDLAPQPGDRVLTKWRYSAFHATGLHEMLTAEDRTQLVVVGVFAHIGCLVTAIDAYSRDIEVFLPADGLADFDRERHMLALRYAAANCAVVTDTAAALRSLEPRG